MTMKDSFQIKSLIILLTVKTGNIQLHGKMVPNQERRTFHFVSLVPHHIYKSVKLGHKSWKISDRTKLLL